MLDYRHYLESIRLQRGRLESSIHYQVDEEGDSGKSRESIKKLVSKPNYGEIFYSDKKTRDLTDDPRSRHLRLPNQHCRPQQQAQANLQNYLGSLASLDQENDRLTKKLSTQQISTNWPSDQTEVQFVQQKRPGLPQAAYGQSLGSILSSNQQTEQNQQLAREYFQLNHSPQQLSAPPPSQSVPRWSLPQAQQPPRPLAQRQPNQVRVLLGQKLRELKQRDEQLRHYTIRVLRGPTDI